jgi:capsule synthesis protein PGA_cap
MDRLLPVGALIAAFGAALVILSPLVTGSSGAPSASLGYPFETNPAKPAKPAKPKDELSIAWAGDITPGSRYGTPPEGGRPLFAAVRKRLRAADLTIGNLEGTLSVGGAAKCPVDGDGCFSFQAPPESAAALQWAGFDLLNLANNHALDFGADGQTQTVAALDRRRLRHTGRPGEITVLRRNGARIAFVGFAPYPWASDLRDPAGVQRLVADASQRAELVVVLAHIGAEGSDQSHVPEGHEYAIGEDRGDTRAFAHAAIDAGADLVLGSGPHVLRGVELYRGKLIAYSLANFAGWHNFSTAGDLGLSGLLTVRLTREGALRGGHLTSLRLTGPGVPTPDGSGAAASLVSQLGREDFGKTGLRLQPDGSF